MPEEEPPTPQILGQFDAFCRERYHAVVALIYALTGNKWTAEDLA